MPAINDFLLKNNLRIAANPCVSPDFCLDWPALRSRLQRGDSVPAHAASRFETAAGAWTLLEDPATGDCAWRLEAKTGAAAESVLGDGAKLADGSAVFPASFDNLIRIKNLAQKHNPKCTIFPTAGDNLGRSTLGIGARFTTLHWPAVEWAMAQLKLGMTANQNSIPRELVYDVNAMLDGRLDTVPFPFIGANVPEGHQGHSVEGMSHGCILSKLRTGFHRRGIAWSFNSDHQPIGGKFDSREDALVAGCVFASYITFDLSPELAQTTVPADAAGWVGANVDGKLVATVKARVAAAGVAIDEAEFAKLLAYVWPSMKKMQSRDAKYRAAREKAFTEPVGREYLRELSIDELPGLTTAATTAIMLALCEALGMKIHFVAPAFGFQKNMPYPDNAALKELIAKQWAVCAKFGASIGFHSGSGKSAENYQVMGAVTGSRLEIKTSGRYTSEMGKALAASKNATDQGALARLVPRASRARADPARRLQPRRDRAKDGADLCHRRAREIRAGGLRTSSPSRPSRGAALEALLPSPEHMFWFEYNFLHVLAGGRPRREEAPWATTRRRATPNARAFTRSATRAA